MIGLLKFMPALLATAAGGGVNDIRDGEGTFWMPPQASTTAGAVDHIFYLILWICVVFFVLIVACMAWFMVKYRRREEGQPVEKSATHNTPLELTWTMIPLVIVIALFTLGLRGYITLTEEPANAYEVYVTGQKWSWSFDHPQYGVTDAAVLTVPAGRPVKMIMTSTDVLHAMFVPAFRVKQDAVPGRYTKLWFEAPEPGTHQMFCAEYCGTDHSRMTAVVQVLEPEAFDAEMTRRANILATLTEADYPTYALERIYPRCSSCHRLDAVTKQGPGFAATHDLWGKSRTMADGSTVTVDENYIRKSLLNPQADIAEGTNGVMPTFQGQLKELEIRAMIEFIKRLDEVVDEQGNPR